MNKRKIIIGSIGALILLAGFLLSKKLASRDNSPPEISKDAYTVVKTIKVKTGEIQSENQVTGRIIPANKVDVYSEVTGIAHFRNKPFKTGETFRKGEVLISMDDSEFRSSLISQKSQFTSSLANVLPDIRIDYQDEFQTWQQFLENFEIDKTAPALPKVENKQLKLFLTGRGLYSAYYKILEAEKRLSKFTIRAPFDGTVTEAYLNEGALIRIGQQLGEFIKTGDYELEASLENSIVTSLKKGMKLKFTQIGKNQTFEGNLIRVNDKLDPGTQLIKVFFSFKNERLKSGMYLQALLPVKSYSNAVKLPLTALVEDNYLFTVEDSTAVKKQIELMEKDTESIIVKGLTDNSKVIIDKKNSAFEGSKVIEM